MKYVIDCISNLDKKEGKRPPPFYRLLYTHYSCDILGLPLFLGPIVIRVFRRLSETPSELGLQCQVGQSRIALYSGLCNGKSIRIGPKRSLGVAPLKLSRWSALM